jgi:hypothetical protein
MKRFVQLIPDLGKGYQDFLLVFVKNAVSFLVTLVLWQCSQAIFGFASNSLIARKTIKSFPQSSQ